MGVPRENRERRLWTSVEWWWFSSSSSSSSSDNNPKKTKMVGVAIFFFFSERGLPGTIGWCVWSVGNSHSPQVSRVVCLFVCLRNGGNQQSASAVGTNNIIALISIKHLKCTITSRR